MNYQDLENENLSVEDAKLREMCGGLKRVSAPKDFDFRLKARIANHQPQTAKSPIFAFLKYAAPLGLGLVFLGVIVSNNLFSVDNSAVPSLAAGYAETPRPQVDLPIESDTNQPLIAQNRGPNANFENEMPQNANVNLDQTLAAKNPNSLGRIFERSEPKFDNANGGSSDKAITVPNVIQPKGLNNSNTTAASNSFSRPTSFSVKEILSQTLGIEASFTGNGWRVQTVRQNTSAERSGIKPNDVIEAIDGIKLLTETIRTNSIGGKKISIIRDGQKFEITLR